MEKLIGVKNEKIEITKAQKIGKKDHFLYFTFLETEYRMIAYWKKGTFYLSQELMDEEQEQYQIACYFLEEALKKHLETLKSEQGLRGPIREYNVNRLESLRMIRDIEQYYFIKQKKNVEGMKEEIVQIVEDCKTETKSSPLNNNYIHFAFIGESGYHLAKLFLTIFDGIEIVQFDKRVQEEDEWILIPTENECFYNRNFSSILQNKLRKKGFQVYITDMHQTIEHFDAKIIKKLGN